MDHVREHGRSSGMWYNGDMLPGGLDLPLGNGTIRYPKIRPGKKYLQATESCTLGQLKTITFEKRHLLAIY